MGQAAADVRQGLRRLTATPLLSLGATLILAIGIGSAVVMVDVLDRLLLRAPSHVTDPDRVSRTADPFAATSALRADVERREGGEIPEQSARW